MARTRDVSNVLVQPFAVTLGTSNYRAGVNAGNSIQSGGNYNTVVGDEAGTAITTGDENTLVGYVSGDAITTGIRNVAIGSYALSTNVAGDQSVAVGHGALFTQNPSGNADMNNTAVGHDAGNQVTTGVQNTLIGGLAGDSITTANTNTLVGYQAGHNLTTGGANTLIGSNNIASAVDVATEIVIGRNGSGSGAATVTLCNGDTDAVLALDGSDTSWAATSDERLKKNIVTSTAGLSFVNELRPVQYEWKNKGEVTSSITKYYEADSTEPCRGEGGTFHGFIAQEIKTAIDNHSSQFSNKHNIWKERLDGMQSVSQGNLVPMLVKAIQELTAANTALEARIKTLEDA